MLVAKTFQPVGERSGPKIGATGDDQPGRLAPGVRIDDLHPTAFLTRHFLVVRGPGCESRQIIKKSAAFR